MCLDSCTSVLPSIRTIRMPIRYASGAVTPVRDTTNWVKNSPAIAGAMCAIDCIVAPARPMAPALSLVPLCPDCREITSSAAIWSPFSSSRSRVAQVLLVGVLGLGGFVDDRPDRADHRLGGVALEDVAAHVHAGRAVFDRVVRHGERVAFRQLLAAGHDQRDRAPGRDRVEVLLAVVGLDEVG